jgi:hypothetical protein
MDTHRRRFLTLPEVAAALGVLLAPVLAIGHPQAAAAVPAGWKTYQNARFGYSVRYPGDLLRPLPEADDGDGRHFQPVHGHADVAVWASYGADDTLRALADEAAQGCIGGRASYRVVRDHDVPPFMALSCLEAGGEVLYAKALRCKDVTTQIQLTYPAAEKPTWDQVAAKMSASLGAGCGVG